MKKILFLLVLAASLTIGLLTQSGCKTVTTITTDPNGNQVTNAVVVFDPIAAQNAISGIAELGVYMAVKQDTNTIAYFQLAATTINGLANAGQFDPVKIEQELNALNVNGLSGPYAQLGVRAALIFYKTAFATVLSEKLDQVKNLKPILLALSGGITSGLSGVGIETKYHLPPTRR